MRHRYKAVKKLTTGPQKRDLLIRNMLTSLVKNGEVVTTTNKAKVLKSEADKFFARLIRMFDKYEDQKDVKREAIRYVKSVIFTDEEGKKVIEDILPKYKKQGLKSGFVKNYKLGFRVGDGAEKILIRLV